MKDEFDPTQLMDFMMNVGDRAGAILRSYFNHEFRVDTKGDNPKSIDIVTEADHASEDMIMAAIMERFPDHDILTEETPTAVKGSRWLWVVDPLDGTVNFAHGYPVFGVSIALTENGQVVAGLVYDPLKDERFHAVRGHGAFLNGNPISVSKADRLRRSILATGFPYDKAWSEENNLREFSAVLPHVQGMRRGGSAAVDLCYVACGRLDGFWEPKLKPWDMAAGMLMVQEAGGTVTDRAGNQTDPYTAVIVATNGLIHDSLLKILNS